MSITPYKRVTSDDVTGDWAKDSQLLTGVVGRFMSDTQESMSGGLQMGQNVTAEYKTVNINTPASDWTAMTLLNGWTSTVAVSNGFAAPRWRYSANGIQLSGGFEYNGGVGAPTLPLTLAQLPANLVDFNEDAIFWSQITVAGPANDSGAAVLRLDPTGALSVRSIQGLTPATVVFCGLDGVTFPAPLLALPQTQPALSCFPVQYQTKLPGGQARQVEQVKVLDLAGPYPVSVGQPAWYCDGKGNIVINDLKGLALGRHYQVTFRGMP